MNPPISLIFLKNLCSPSIVTGIFNVLRIFKRQPLFPNVPEPKAIVKKAPEAKAVVAKAPEIKAVLNPEGKCEANFQVHPAAKSPALLAEMLDTAEENLERLQSLVGKQVPERRMQSIGN